MWVPDLAINRSWLVGAAIAVAGAFPVGATENYVLGRCKTADHEGRQPSRGAEIRPIYDGGSYLYKYHGNDPRYKEKLNGELFEGAKVTLIKAPSHGRLALEDQRLAASNSWYHYWPQAGYSGRDRFVMQVEKDGVKVGIHYLVEVLSEGEPDTGICVPELWKISLPATTREQENASLACS